MTGPVTVTGPLVRTGVTFPPDGHVRLRLSGWDGVDLGPDLVASLLAAGLETGERDPAGLVVIGEIEVDDAVGFLVGATAIDHDTAMRAVARGVERAIELYVASWRARPPAAPAAPPGPGGSE